MKISIPAIFLIYFMNAYKKSKNGDAYNGMKGVYKKEKYIFFIVNLHGKKNPIIQSFELIIIII